MTYNEDYSLDLNVMNENRDVIFSVSRADEEMIFEKAGWNAETDWTKVKRIFRMEVQQDEQNEESEKINISLEYHHEDISQPAQMVVGESLSQTVSDLQNVYIMYYPNYASVEAKIMDCFDVNLNQQESFDLCIVKQKYDTAKSEDYYTVSFDVMDLQPLNREHTDRVILRTNLGKDLYDVNSEAVRQSAVKYSYRDRNGAILRGEEARQRMGFLEQVPQSLLGQKKKNSPMFKTIVEIFPSGTCDGRNPSKFTSTEPLVKLTNE